MKKDLTMNVSALIDRRIGGYQFQILILCFLISVIDGLDSQIMSVTGPVIASDLALPPSSLGLMFSASQWGALFGAFFFGFYADRFGRRRVLIFCGLLMSFATVLTGMANSYDMIVTLRFITGLGVGGAVPCFLSLATEYSPGRHRATVVSAMVAAVPTGGLVAGIIGAAVLTTHDWRFVYSVCGALSLVITLLVVIRMPESAAYLVTRKKDPSKIRKILARILPGEIDPQLNQFVLNDAAKEGDAKVSVRNLFTDNRAKLTILCRIAFFVSYLVLIGTLVWTPGLMRKAGMSISDASLMLSLNNIGGIIGLFLVGYFADRFRARFWTLLTALYVGGAASIALMGYTAPSFWPVAIFSALTGVFMASGFGVLYSFAAQLYPTFVRSTGVGWASGLGRVGSSMGPLAVGWMFAGGWQISNILFMLAILAAVNIIVVSLMRSSGKAVQEDNTAAIPSLATNEAR